jgi:hypothetical protein
MRKKKTNELFDKVLLNDEEYANAYLDGVKGLNERGSIERVRSGQNMQKRRQCTKLLEWLRDNDHLNPSAEVEALWKDLAEKI